MFKHLVATLIVLIVPCLAPAQPLADRVPADAIVYIGWQGSQAMPAAYAESHLKAVLDAANFGALVGDFLPRVAEQLGQGNPDVAPVMKMINTFGTPLWQHPSAIYIAAVDFKAPGGPRPHLAILCQAGKDADALLAQLKPITDAAEGAPFPIKAFKAGDVVVLAAGYDKETDALAAAGKGLPSNPRFQQAIAQVQKDPVAILYLDAEAVLAQVNEGFATLGKPNDAAEWNKIRDALGLPGLKQLILTGGFDGRDWSEQAFIAAPAPRRGLLSFLESKPISDEALKLIPQSAIAAGVERMDLSAMFDFVRTLVVEMNPKGPAEFDRGMAQANQAVGFDLRRDLLDAFGSEWAYYSNPGAIDDPAGLVVVNRLNKPVEAERSLGQLEQMAQKALARAPQATFTFSSNKVGQLTIHTIAMPQISLSWTISNGRFYVSTTLPRLTQAIENAGKGRTIIDNADLAALRKRLGGAQAISMNYADLSKTGPLMYPAIVQLAELGFGFARQAGIQPPAGVFPPFERLAGHLNVAASFSWTDETGWHLRGLSPFPGSSLLSPSGNMSSSVGTTALVVSIMLPALNAAKERANRVKCASNLRQIGQGCALYLNDNKKYPANLGLLVKEDDLSSEVFVCPAGNTEIPEKVRNGIGDRDTQAKWVVEHSDYIYLGTTVKPNDNADTILAHEKFDNHDGDGINLLFNDGHVEWQRLDMAKAAIQKQQGNPPAGN